MKKFTFILGGARSGKSSYAVSLAKSVGKKVIFIATCINSDEEMERRIKLHKESRPDTWEVIEEGVNIDSALRMIKTDCDVILIDCLGLFISNLMAAESSNEKVEIKIRLVVEQIRKMTADTIVVSNEVGMGIVPDNPAARRFRDLLGRANQIFTQNAGRVIMMYAGIPIIIKGEKDAAVK